MRLSRFSLLLVGALFLAGCKPGGTLQLEGASSAPPVIPTTGQSAAAQTLGGASLVVEQGKTKQTGYHGWVSLNAVESKTLSAGDKIIIMDKQPPPVR